MVTGSSRMLQHARRLARRRADAPGDLGEVVRLVEAPRRLVHAAPVDEVVPLGDEVPERAALVAERDAAVHAARRLRAHLRLGVAGTTSSRQSLHALLDRALVLLCARDAAGSPSGRPSAVTRSSRSSEDAPPLVRHRPSRTRALAPRARGRSCPARCACAPRAPRRARAASSSSSGVERLEVHHRLADAPRERAVVVEHVGDAAAHPGGEVAARRPEHDDRAARSCTRTRGRLRPRRPRARRCCAPRSARPRVPAKKALPLVAP